VEALGFNKKLRAAQVALQHSLDCSSTITAFWGNPHRKPQNFWMKKCLPLVLSVWQHLGDAHRCSLRKVALCANLNSHQELLLEKLLVENPPSDSKP
jgi:hypothetical protein